MRDEKTSLKGARTLIHTFTWTAFFLCVGSLSNGAVAFIVKDIFFSEIKLLKMADGATINPSDNQSEHPFFCRQSLGHLA